MNRRFLTSMLLVLMMLSLLASSGTAQDGDNRAIEPLLVIPYERTRSGHLDNGVAWNPDESRFLFWSSDGILWVLDATNGARVLDLPVPDTWIYLARWNSTGTRIMVWDSGVAWVFDASDGQELFILRHPGLRDAIWNSEEDRILTLGADGTARVWSADSGDELFVLQHETGVEGGMWSANGNRILTWDCTARIWDPTNGQELLTLHHSNCVTGMSWSADENRILAWGAPRLNCTGKCVDRAWIWDTKTGEVLLTLDHERYIRSATWNEDGTRVFTWSLDGYDTVRAFEVERGKELFSLRHLERSTEGIGLISTGVQWSRDRSRILTWSIDDTVRVWSAETGNELLSLPHSSEVGGVESAMWSPDASRILSLSTYEGTGKIWNGSTGDLLYTLHHGDWISHAVWNLDGTRIISSGGYLTTTPNYTVKVWVVPIIQGRE